MEATKKLKYPTGTVHDIKYLYVVLDALSNRAAPLPANGTTFEYLKSALNAYNELKAAKYQLSFSPRAVNTTVVKHLLLELKTLGLLRIEDGRFILTQEGQAVALMIQMKKSNELREFFARAMLDTFRVFEFFLKRVSEASGGEGIPVPFITAEVFDRFAGDPRKIAESYVGLVSRHTKVPVNHSKLNQLLESHASLISGNKTAKIKKLQSLFERLIIEEAFRPEIRSRRIYDFVRTRTTLLWLTNYCTYVLEGLPVERAYLTSGFDPSSFRYSTRKLDYRGGVIYVHAPSYEEIKDDLVATIKGVYEDNKDEFGYVRIAQTRDLVCRKLKIPDKLFDGYLQRLYHDQPHLFSFTYSGASEKVTEKQLPLLIESPAREYYTLLKVNIRR